MFGRVGVTVCIAFIMLALVELSSANPVIGKKSNLVFVHLVFLIDDVFCLCCWWNVKKN